MFQLMKITAVVYLKSGSKLKIKCKKGSFETNSEGNFNHYSLEGAVRDIAINLNEIEAVEFVQPWWINILHWIRS